MKKVTWRHTHSVVHGGEECHYQSSNGDNWMIKLPQMLTHKSAPFFHAQMIEWLEWISNQLNESP